MSRSRAAHRIICALARNAEATSMATQGMLAQRMTSLLANGAQMGSTGARCPCGRTLCPGHRYSTSSDASLAQAARAECVSTNLAGRMETVLQHFPKALNADDFIARVEIALAGYGFTGDNSIAMSNLCRDESCLVLEDKIESVFGSCFSTHGLGGVLTCGVIGIKAGLSHSPIVGGRERYVFFSMPHIAIDSDGKIGGISRPGRPGASSACGALIACTAHLRSEGLEANCKTPGEHDPLEPEYSILKQRLARRLRHECADASKLNLVSVTKAAERTITSDLEYLIEKAVDTKKADYAVFTGVQIHNWSSNLDDPTIPSLEFVSVGKSYVVVNGEKTYLDIHQVPALSPRQLKILASTSLDPETASATAATASGMVQEIPRDYLIRRLGGLAGKTTMAGGKNPSWIDYMQTSYAEAHPNAPRMDDHVFQDPSPPKEEKTSTSFFSLKRRK